MRRNLALSRLPALAVILALVVSLSTAANPPPARADGSYQTLPFSQNWSNAGLITADDNWDGVPGVVGYLGNYSGGSPTGVDPQTLLSDFATNDVDVQANEANPNTFTTGGVAEFDTLTNPTVALQGSGTADAPHLLIRLNTTGQTNINVQYKLRDVDGSEDNETQQVALHYRVGESGNFTNIPAAYVLDATTGPSLAEREINVNVTLPAAANNQAQLQLRIITTNAPSSDEWVGVDDINITALGAGDVGPSVTSVSPSSPPAALPNTNITLNFSEPVTAAADAVTLSCNGSPVGFAGLPVGAPGASQIVLDPTADLPFEATCSGTVVADKVADVDGTPNTMIGNFNFGFTVAPDPCSPSATITKISAVQGSGNATPIAGSTVTVEGVVTALLAPFDGFFIQEEQADEDADQASSEGLFIRTGAAGLPEGLLVGEQVRVTGTAAESGGMTQLSGPTVQECGVTVSPIGPTDVSLPFGGAGFQERYEGMLVRLPQQLTISEYFNFDRFGEYTLALPREGETRLVQPTHVVEPGAAANALASENLLRRIIVDDARNTQNADPAIHPNGQPFTLQNRFRGGDTVTGLQGILTQQFGTYRVQPTVPGTYTAVNQRHVAPPVVGGTLRVGAMNTLNYFLTLDTTADDNGPGPCGTGQNLDCRGADADQPQEFTRQRAKLLSAIRLLAPDVLGLNEIENTPGVEPLADIVAGLNATVGEGAYAYIDTGVIGSDAIRVGLIYKPAKVVPVGAFKLLTSAQDARFRDDKNRPVLAQTFREVASGELFTVAVAHLKSKGSACNDVGDPDTGDGQGNCNLTRRNAAQALVDWLATDPTGSGDPDFLIVGDLNSYAKEDPIDAILAGPDDAAGTADDFTNLIAKYQGAAAYSYVFDAQVGYLDHALASASLTAQSVGADELHINADEPDLLDYDTTFKADAQDALYEPNAFRSSDHDPVMVGLDLGTDDPDPPPPDPDPGPDPDPNDPKPFKVRLPIIRR